MPKIKTKSGAKKRFKVTGSRKNQKKACLQKPHFDQKIKKA